jgi:hypothetical protein
MDILNNSNDSNEYRNEKEIEFSKLKSNTIEFLSQERKNGLHSCCVLLYKGLDFQVNCKCYFYTRNKEVGRAHISPISYYWPVLNSEVKYLNHKYPNQRR